MYSESTATSICLCVALVEWIINKSNKETINYQLAILIYVRFSYHFMINSYWV